MASPTQTVVGKGKPNPFKAEGLLKILKENHSPSLLKSPINPRQKDDGSTKFVKLT